MKKLNNKIIALFMGLFLISNGLAIVNAAHISPPEDEGVYATITFENSVTGEKIGNFLKTEVRGEEGTPVIGDIYESYLDELAELKNEGYEVVENPLVAQPNALRYGQNIIIKLQPKITKKVVDKIVTRTINYIVPEGTEKIAPKVETINYKITTDFNEVTKKEVEGSASYTFSSGKDKGVFEKAVSPVVKGLEADKKEVEEKTILPKDLPSIKNITVNVTYTKIKEKQDQDKDKDKGDIAPVKPEKDQTNIDNKSKDDSKKSNDSKKASTVVEKSVDKDVVNTSDNNEAVGLSLLGLSAGSLALILRKKKASK